MKLWLFFTWFIFFYLLVNFSFSLPNEYNGQSIAVLLRNSSRGYQWQLMDMALWLFFAMVPYLIMIWLFPQKKLYCFLLLPVAVVIVYLLRFYMDRINANRPIDLTVHLFKYSYFIVSFTLFPFIFFFIRYAQYKSLQAKELLLQNRQSELNFLRSQVNPHFLFNSLNNIYSLVFNNSVQALPAIAGFSDILRYMLYESIEKVSLDKEIHYIKKYIELQMLRFEEPVNINLQVSGPVTEIRLPPLLFIPFVENAFKHGELNNKNEELFISIATSHKETVFQCRNKKGAQRKDSTPGIGIDNVKRRLQLLYPGRHILNTKNIDQHFDINLTLFHEK